VIRLMARDYMAIPASSCLAERSFSMSACTDDVRQRQMGSEKFGALQRLRAAYRDGRLEAVKAHNVADLCRNSRQSPCAKLPMYSWKPTRANQENVDAFYEWAN